MMAVPTLGSDQDNDVMSFNAPIISLPAQASISSPGAAGDSAIVIDNEVDVLPRKRPRPLAKLDQFPSIPDADI